MQQGVSVQEMVSGIELIVGARQDPQFGPFLVVGAGGVFVDMIEDTSIRLLPVDTQEAISML
jgi:acyl-CoA synthetase (NDP forming)